MGSETNPAEIKKKKKKLDQHQNPAATGLFADVVIVQLLYGTRVTEVRQIAARGTALIAGRVPVAGVMDLQLLLALAAECPVGCGDVRSALSACVRRPLGYFAALDASPAVAEPANDDKGSLRVNTKA